MRGVKYNACNLCGERFPRQPQDIPKGRNPHRKSRIHHLNHECPKRHLIPEVKKLIGLSNYTLFVHVCKLSKKECQRKHVSKYLAEYMRG